MMVEMAEHARDGHGAALALWHDTISRLALVIFPLAVVLVLMAPDVIVTLFTSDVSRERADLHAVEPDDSAVGVRASTRCCAPTPRPVSAGAELLRLALVVALIGWCFDVWAAGRGARDARRDGSSGALALVRIARLLGVRRRRGAAVAGVSRHRASAPARRRACLAADAIERRRCHRLLVARRDLRCGVSSGVVARTRAFTPCDAASHATSVPRFRRDPERGRARSRTLQVLNRKRKLTYVRHCWNHSLGR